MLSIKSLDMLDSFLLLGAANARLAQVSLHLLQLKLGREELLILSVTPLRCIEFLSDVLGS